MRPIATGDLVVSFYFFVRRLRCAKTAEQIEGLFGVEAPGKPRKIVFDAAIASYFDHLLLLLLLLPFLKKYFGSTYFSML